MADSFDAGKGMLFENSILVRAAGEAPAGTGCECGQAIPRKDAETPCYGRWEAKPENGVSLI